MNSCVPTPNIINGEELDPPEDGAAEFLDVDTDFFQKA